MKLFIAEKPELARAIASGIDGHQQFGDGFIKKGDNVITWAFGHILELAEPVAYNEKYKSWNLQDLPFNIGFNDFVYVPKKESKKQLKIISTLIHDKNIDSIVHCGDADDEGQLLIEEILSYTKNDKPVERLLINDVTPKGVKKELANIQPNDNFKSLKEKGFARSQADWLVGFNLTRAYTTVAQKNGYDGVLSVGRVQTPVLGLVVARDKEHENHKSSNYYFIQGKFSIDGFEIIANLKTDEKITDENITKSVYNDCINKSGLVISKNENKKEAAPLPYNLLILQAECSKKFGYKPDKTLKITQTLRENHHLITYNRSDCQYLPENLLEYAPETLSLIKNNLQDEFIAYVDNSDSSIKSKAWNDKNISAHHGIIPTAQNCDKSKLSKDELNIYQLICKRYIAQFYQPKEYIHSEVEININENIFSASSNETTKQGYSILFDKEDKEQDKEDEQAPINKNLKNIKNNSSAKCEDISMEKKATKPKPYYTMSALLKDLSSVSKYVSDAKIKKLLLEKDEGKKGERGGIGTPATRSEHIKTLFTRGYIQEVKKSIVSTKKGRDLIALSPTSLTTPDMTALWFERQKDIESGKITREQFLSEVLQEIKDEIARVKSPDSQLQKFKSDDAILCPQCKKGYLKRRKSVKNGKTVYWWGCSEFSNGCKAMFYDNKGKPNLKG